MKKIVSSRIEKQNTSLEIDFFFATVALHFNDIRIYLGFVLATSHENIGFIRVTFPFS